jgi:hypothetical protein
MMRWKTGCRQNGIYCVCLYVVYRVAARVATLSSPFPPQLERKVAFVEVTPLTPYSHFSAFILFRFLT